MSPEHRWLSLNGKQIDCALFTPTRAKPASASVAIGTASESTNWSQCRLVLLHEGLGCIALWRQFPQQLADTLGEPVLAYSRYGYGQSQPLGEARNAHFMHDEADTPLRELREQLGLGEVILIGHSDGASIALIHAALQPTGVRALVVIAPHLFVEPFGLVAISQARADFEASDLANRMQRYHREPRLTFSGWCDVWQSPQFRSWDIQADVAKLACPVLAIQGEDDQYGTLHQIERIAQLHADTRLLKLRDCRHSPHLERPEQTLQAVSEFVRNLL